MADLTTNAVNPNWIIRPARPGDAPAIASLMRRVFTETYGHVIAPDALERYLDTDFCERAIADARASRPFLLVFGTEGLAGVGEMHVHPPPACVPAQDSLEIARFYIHATYRGSGAAGALLAACERYGQDRQRSALWLCTWEQNPRAVAFYHKHGFKIVGTMEIVASGVVFHDWVMMKDIQAHPNREQALQMLSQLASRAKPDGEHSHPAHAGGADPDTREVRS